MDTETFFIPVRNNLLLRFIQPHEAEVLYRLVDENGGYLREWLPWVDAQVGPQMSRENILKRIEQAKKGETLDLGIYMDGALVGSMGFNAIERESRRGEIGYWLAQVHEGQGIMAECVKSLVSYGFEELSLHRIEIHCSINNTKSSAIPERLGFKLDGILRDGSFLYDHFEDSRVYSILENEWVG